jgi:hypothetical protein
MNRVHRLVVGVWMGLCIILGTVGLTTAQASAGLRVESENVLLIPAPVAQVVRVIQSMNVVNSASTAQDLTVTLPDGYEELSVEGLDNVTRYVQGNRLLLPRFVQAGTTQFTLTYKLAFDAQQGKQLSLHSDYPVDSAKLYLPIGNTALSAEGLQTTTQTTSVSGTEFRVFTRLGIPQGDDWGISVQMLPVSSSSAHLSGLPVVGLSSSNAGNTIQAIGNLLLAAFILMIGLISIRSTQWGRAGQRAKTEEDAILSAWIQTELQFQQGMLSEPEYEVARQEFKRKLVELRLTK